MPINILVTVDESIVRKDIERCLGNLGYNVVASADNGEDAINMAMKHKPDLALMDIMIKGDMNGIAAAEEIKRNMDIPVVFLTAYADESTKNFKQSVRIGFPQGVSGLKQIIENPRYATGVGLIKRGKMDFDNDKKRKIEGNSLVKIF